MPCKEIKVAYGWCATQHIVCPVRGSSDCSVLDKYSRCQYFRKVGAQSAIEETDGNGKRRVYFETPEGLYQDSETGEHVRYCSQSKTILDSGVGK